MATTKTAQPPRTLTKSEEASLQVGFQLMGFNAKASKKLTQQVAGTTAIGLNRFSTEFIKIVKKVDRTTTDILQGVPTDVGAQKINPLKYGLIPLVELMSSIDLCNILNYLIDQVPGGKKFNPNDTKERDTALGRAKYKLQYAAYRIQGYIDGYYNAIDDISNPKNPENVSKAQDVVIKIVQEFRNLTETTDDLFNNAELNNAFPQLANYTNFFTVANTFFDQYTDIRRIPTGPDFKKILSYIDKTRSTCILIQGLNKPRDLIAFADTFLGGKLAEQIQKLQKLIDPKKIESVVKSIQKGVNVAYKAIKSLLTAINIVRTIISIASIIIKVLFVIAKFLKKLPIPSIFTTTAEPVTIGDAVAKLQKKVDFFTDRLNEINRILSAVYFFCQKRLTEFGQILNYLQVVRINLQNCDLQESKNETIQNIDSAVTDTQSTINDLNNYINTYDNNNSKRKKRIGEYTIQILTEEVVDEGINLRRRYGIALNNRGIVVAKSVPTFATDDRVIIDEVKLLLPKQNLTGLIPSEYLAVMDESANYLDTDEPAEQDVFTEDEEIEEDNDDEDSDPPAGLGLQGFVNKLKGGRRLRRRMRRETAKAKRKLANELRSSDPNSQATKKSKIDSLKAEIGVVKDDIAAAKRKLTVTIAAAVLNPLLRPVIIIFKKRVDDLVKLLKQKENELSKLSKTSP
jgi:hypothetical protein